WASPPRSTTTTASTRPERPPELFPAHHFFGLHPRVELFWRDEAQLHRRFLQRLAGLVGGLGDLRRVVVADMGVEGGHQHQRVLQVLADALAVGLDSLHAVLAEAAA